MPDIVLPDELPPALEGGMANEALNPHQFGFAGDWGENPTLKRANQVAENSFGKINSIEEMRLNRVEDMVIHCRKVKRNVDSWSREWCDNWQSVKTDLKRERQRVEEGLATKAGLKVNPDYRSAIVGVFSGLKPDERMAAIDAAIAEGDGPTLAVLLEAPPLVTGLTADLKASIKTRAYSKADPASYGLLQQLDKSLVRAERASLAAIDTMQRLLAGTNRFDKKLERSKAAEARLAG